MTARPVRVRSVMHLEPERMLQEVPRLLARQAAHDYCPRSDVHDLQLSQFRQVPGGRGELFWAGLLVRAFTSGQLGGRADVAQVANTDVPVVVGQPMGPGRSRLLPAE